MVSYLLDVAFIVVVGATAWILVRRSLLESATAWFAFVLSALIALNCFEPFADFIVEYMFVENDIWFTCFFWFASVIVIFTWLTVMIWIGFHKVLDEANLNLGKFDLAGRWFFSLLGGYTLAAFLLTTLHTLPAPRDFWGAFPPELHRRSSPVMVMGPDYQLLTFTEYTCNPRSAISGAPWIPKGPLFEADLRGNRWSSFPVRYAIWREAMQIILYESYLEEPDTGSSDDSDLNQDQDSNLAVLARGLGGG